MRYQGVTWRRLNAARRERHGERRLTTDRGVFHVLPSYRFRAGLGQRTIRTHRSLRPGCRHRQFDPACGDNRSYRVQGVGTHSCRFPGPRRCFFRRSHFLSFFHRYQRCPEDTRPVIHAIPPADL